MEAHSREPYVVKVLDRVADAKPAAVEEHDHRRRRGGGGVGGGGCCGCRRPVDPKRRASPVRKDRLHCFNRGREHADVLAGRRMRRELREAVDAALAQLVERLVLPRIGRRWVTMLQCRCSDIRGKRVEGARTAAPRRRSVVALRRVRGPRQQRRRRSQGAGAGCQAGAHRVKVNAANRFPKKRLKRNRSPPPLSHPLPHPLPHASPYVRRPPPRFQAPGRRRSLTTAAPASAAAAHRRPASHAPPSPPRGRPLNPLLPLRYRRRPLSRPCRLHHLA